MKRRGGFTSAELMVVMAMMGIGVVILTVAFHGVGGRARTLSCVSNISGLCLSARMYMQDNDGRMPALPPIEWPDYGMAPAAVEGYPGMDPGMDEELLMGEGPRIGGWEICGGLMVYVKNQQVFRCPSAPHREKPPEYETEASWDDHWGWFQVDYIFNLSARSDDPPTTILVSDDAADRHPGRTWNAVRVDGSAVRLRAARWDEFWVAGPATTPLGAAYGQRPPGDLGSAAQTPGSR